MITNIILRSFEVCDSIAILGDIVTIVLVILEASTVVRRRVCRNGGLRLQEVLHEVVGEASGAPQIARSRSSTDDDGFGSSQDLDETPGSFLASQPGPAALSCSARLEQNRQTPNALDPNKSSL